MKKILLAIAILLVLLLAAIYLLIPGKISIVQRQAIGINQPALTRNLSNERNWKQWWPGEIQGTDSSLVYLLNGLRFQLHDVKILSLPIRITGSNVSLPAELMMVALNPDSVNIQANSSITTTSNPLTRIRAYLMARKIKKNFSIIFQSISTYYAETKNLYGYDIRNTSVVDSILLMNVRETKGYPSTKDIYELVDELKTYIKKQGATETGYPMLNIFTKDSINYQLKVAIPTDKKLPSSGNMSYRWMLGGGNILITEVTGDAKEIEKAYRQIHLYISDHKRVAPAIPFESLVTDRRLEPDSSKWVTRIYYPVM